MSRTVGNTRGVKKRCDDLFSQVIRSRGKCEDCGRMPPEVKLQTAHLLSRRFIRTRYEPSNAFCLCAACHMAMTDDPVRFAWWAVEYDDPGSYFRLVELAHSKTKFDWAEVERELKIMVEHSA